MSSGVLPEQAARPADFREALGHALRAALHADDVGEAAAALGPTHVRRLQQQQQIHLALIERLRDPPRPTATLQEAWAANAKRHAWAPAAPLDAHYYDSLRKHVDAHDLLEMYTSGFFGPKMSRLYRVRDRLDSLGVAMLRAPLEVHGVQRRLATSAPFSYAAEPMASTLEAKLEALLVRCSQTHLDLTPQWWLALQTLLSLAQGTASPRPIHVAARHLLGAPPDARGLGSGAAEGTGAAAGADAAPGMGYRLARLYHVLLDKGLGGGGGGVAAGDERRLSGSGEAAAGSATTCARTSRSHAPMVCASGGAASASVSRHVCRMPRLRSSRKGARVVGRSGHPAATNRAHNGSLARRRRRRLVAALAGAAAPLETLLLRAPPARRRRCARPPTCGCWARGFTVWSTHPMRASCIRLSTRATRGSKGGCALHCRAVRAGLAPHTVGALVRLLKHLLPAGASGTLPAAGPALQAAAAALRYLTLHLLALRSAGLDLEGVDIGALEWLDAGSLDGDIGDVCAPLLELRDPLLALAAGGGGGDGGGPAFGGDSELGGAMRLEAAAAILCGERLFFSSPLERAAAVVGLLAAVAEPAPPPALLALSDGLLPLLALAPAVSSLLVADFLANESSAASSTGVFPLSSATVLLRILHAPTAERLAAAMTVGGGPAGGREFGLSRDVRRALMSAAKAHAESLLGGRELPHGGGGRLPARRRIARTRAARRHRRRRRRAGGALRVLAIELVDPRASSSTPRRPTAASRLRGTVVGATMPHLLDGLGLLSSFPLGGRASSYPTCTSSHSPSARPPLAPPSTCPRRRRRPPAPPPPPPPPTDELRVLESAHPLDARAETLTVAIEGASHLSVSFDALCETHADDLVTVQLPAPLLSGWSLAKEVAPRGPPPRRSSSARRAAPSSLGWRWLTHCTERRIGSESPPFAIGGAHPVALARRPASPSPPHRRHRECRRSAEGGGRIPSLGGAKGGGRQPGAAVRHRAEPHWPKRPPARQHVRSPLRPIGCRRRLAALLLKAAADDAIAVKPPPSPPPSPLGRRRRPPRRYRGRGRRRGGGGGAECGDGNVVGSMDHWAKGDFSERAGFSRDIHAERACTGLHHRPARGRLVRRKLTGPRARQSGLPI